MSDSKVVGKHTQGPWIVEYAIDESYGDADVISHWVRGKNTEDFLNGLVVASVVSDCVQESEANARLISSAPELLEALESIAYRAETYLEADREMPTPSVEVILSNARAAIAKAKGLAQ